jgi:hypothetical protein
LNEDSGSEVSYHNGSDSAIESIGQLVSNDRILKGI